VEADSTLHGRAVHFTAAHGELDRDTDLCVFTHATYIAQGKTTTADQATVHLRTDGSAERVETSGNVTIAMANGGIVRAPHAVLAMNAASEPKDLQATGGVTYNDKESTATSAREAQGDSAAAHVLFDEHGAAQQAELTGGVHTLERVKENSAAGWTERELHAATVVMGFRAESGASAVLHEISATGDARMRLTAPAKNAAGNETTTLTGDTLNAIFSGRGMTLPDTVHGSGHTVLTQTAANGAINESRGDTLDVQMHPQAKKPAQTFSQVDRAVQQGHVTLTQTPATKNSHSQPMTATADRAEYTGSDDALVLSGNPQVTDGGAQGAMQIAAHRILLLRTSGDAVLTGNVRGNYASAGSQAPAHIMADHAEMHRADQHAIFYGAGKQRARLWQDASQVEAQVLDLDRAAQRLTASGDARDAAAVHAVFTNNPAANDPAQKRTSGVVRVSSRRMVYSSKAANVTRQADFTGGVAVESGDGIIKAQRALVELAPDSGKAASQNAGQSSPLPALSGDVQRITASGQVSLEESGRHAFGEQLVYIPNAGTPNPTTPGANPVKSGGHFVLTGTVAAPPRLVDPAKGNVTGASLIFNSGDDSVVVSGGDGVAGRVHTELKGSP
jgi:lipopolysaccharide export system protein LptA